MGARPGTSNEREPRDRREQIVVLLDRRKLAGGDGEPSDRGAVGGQLRRGREALLEGVAPAAQRPGIARPAGAGEVRLGTGEPVCGRSGGLAARLQRAFETGEAEIARGADHGQPVDGPVEISGRRGPPVGGATEAKTGAQDVDAGGDDPGTGPRCDLELALRARQVAGLERDGGVHEGRVRAQMEMLLARWDRALPVSGEGPGCHGAPPGEHRLGLEQEEQGFSARIRRSRERTPGAAKRSCGPRRRSGLDKDERRQELEEELVLRREFRTRAQERLSGIAGIAGKAGENRLDDARGHAVGLATLPQDAVGERLIGGNRFDQRDVGKLITDEGRCSQRYPTPDGYTLLQQHTPCTNPTRAVQDEVVLQSTSGTAPLARHYTHFQTSARASAKFANAKDGLSV